MNVSSKLFVFFLLSQLLQSSTILYAHATTPIDAPDEIVTQEDLHTALTSKTPAVIMLKMDPCPHCTALRPHFTAAAKKSSYKKIAFYVANGPRLQAAKAIKELSRISIPGFPSIIYVHKNKIVDHQIGGSKKILEEKLTKLAKMK